MITIEKRLDLPDTYPLERIGALEDLLFFDIETTGFSGDRSHLYLIGCTYYQDGSWNLIQWFADTQEAEPELLHSFFSFLKNYRILVHFNGDGFDIPYLLKRCRHFDLPYDFSAVTSVDIYRRIKPYRKLLSLESMKQKSIEQFLGVSRKDRYSGGELISVYEKYLMTHEQSLYDDLILHNEDDLLGMKYLLPLFSYRQIFLEDITLQRIAPANKVFERGNGSIAISCRLPLPLPQPLEVSTPIGELFSDKKDLSILTITLPFVEDVLKHFYKDYHNYYYLPKEERAIHKSVGCYVERQYRRAAKASTCYVKKEGIFLPLPKAQKHFGIQIENYPYEKTFPLYKREYKELRWFAEFDDVFSEKNTGISVYLRDIIKELLITRMECDL